MDGDQKPQAAGTGSQDRPVDNPPSLSEPSLQRTAIAPSPMVSKYAPSSNASQAVAVAPSPAAAPQAAPESVNEGFYRPDDGFVANSAAASADNFDTPVEHIIEWTSSGDDLRARSEAWRIRMSLISVVVGAVIYLITRDIFSTGAVVLMGVLFGFLGSRKPPALRYRIDRYGLTVGEHHYGYNEFRAFSVAEDMHEPSIDIVPLKRFMPLLSVYYDPQQREEIIGMLSTHLPMEVRRHDFFDNIINRIKI